MKTYLLLPKIKIQNANALSSLCTIGFPAMTAWMGFAHALERKIRLSSNLESVHFSGVGVICYGAHLQVYKELGSKQYCIINSLNPNEKRPTQPKKQTEKDSDEKKPTQSKKQTEKDSSEKGNSNDPASFIEEPRIHLCVSLLIQCAGVSGDNEDELAKFVEIALPRMKIAGGDILSFEKPRIYYVSDEKPEQEKKILCQLMPGFALIERRRLLEKAESNNFDALDALLSFFAIHPKGKEEPQSVQGPSYRKGAGWLIPIVVGFQGLSSLGKVKNQRDPTVLHRFVESVVTLGEFKMPYRFSSVEEILWHYEYDESQSLYVCKNEK